jgi:hypothetical protein
MATAVHVRRAPQALAPGSKTKLDAARLEAVASSAPTVELPTDRVLGRQLVEVMVTVGMQDSKSAAKRLIKVRLPHPHPGRSMAWACKPDRGFQEAHASSRCQLCLHVHAHLGMVTWTSAWACMHMC